MALRHERFERRTVPRDGRIAARIVCRAHIHDGSHLGVGLAQHLPSTARGALDRAVAVDAMAVGILAAVIDHRPHGDRQRVGGASFEQTIQTRRPQGEIRDMGRREQHLEGQGVLRGDDTVLEVAVAKEEGVAVGIVAPGGGGIAVEAGVVSPEDPPDAAITGRPAVGTGADGGLCAGGSAASGADRAAHRGRLRSGP